MFSKLRFLTAGESHGQGLTCVIDGIPSSLSLSSADIDRDLARRQKGYGRGGRMKIESDHVQILSGVRHGKTLGSPISFFIENKDWKNWELIMSPESRAKNLKLKKNKLLTLNTKLQPVTRPRPGHADLSGALKYGHRDIRNVLERSSARETAAKVGVGAVAKRLLSEFNIKIISYVTEIGGIKAEVNEKKLSALFEKAEKSLVRCPDNQTEQKMINKIDSVMKRGDSVGGVFEVIALGVPAGLGSYEQWDKRLEARVSYSMMGVQAIKGVEIGMGFDISRKNGSEVMDQIYYKSRKKEFRTRTKVKSTESAGGFYRKTNNAGGIEGGISNGMPIVIRAAMKPIPTLKSPLSSIDINTKKKFRAAYERSDICAVPAASIIGEAAIALVIADCFLEKFGGDSIEEIKRNYKGYLAQIRKF